MDWVSQFSIEEHLLVIVGAFLAFALIKSVTAFLRGRRRIGAPWLFVSSVPVLLLTAAFFAGGLSHFARSFDPQGAIVLRLIYLPGMFYAVLTGTSLLALFLRHPLKRGLGGVGAAVGAGWLTLSLGYFLLTRLGFPESWWTACLPGIPVILLSLARGSDALQPLSGAIDSLSNASRRLLTVRPPEGGVLSFYAEKLLVAWIGLLFVSVFSGKGHLQPSVEGGSAKRLLWELTGVMNSDADSSIHVGLVFFLYGALRWKGGRLRSLLGASMGGGASYAISNNAIYDGSLWLCYLVAVSGVFLVSIRDKDLRRNGGDSRAGVMCLLYSLSAAWYVTPMLMGALICWSESRLGWWGGIRETYANVFTGGYWSYLFWLAGLLVFSTRQSWRRSAVQVWSSVTVFFVLATVVCPNLSREFFLPVVPASAFIVIDLLQFRRTIPRAPRIRPYAGPRMASSPDEIIA